MTTPTDTPRATPESHEPFVEPLDRSRPGGWRGKLADAVATVTGNGFLFLGTLVLGTIGILISVLPPRGHWTFALSKVWARGLLAASGARLESVAASRLDPDRTYVFLANHQSMYDIPAVIASVPLQLRFAAKDSLFRIPVFGWAIRSMGFISVDRSNRSRSGAGSVLATAAERLRGGVSVLFFPEGGRSFDGHLQPFERGGFLLAIKSGLPIVPVGIDGSLDVQMRGRLKISPGPIRVVYGEPIDPAEYGVRGRRQLEARVRSEILAALGREPEEPVAPTEVP